MQLLIIHHTDQNNDGPVREMTLTVHQHNYIELHTNTGQHPSQSDRRHLINGEKDTGNGEVIIWSRIWRLNMSYLDFEKAMSLAPKCKFYTTAGGKTNDEIRKSERVLNLKFSKQCNEFYKKYGYLSFFGNEIYGIDPDDNSGILAGNSVAYALNDRAEYNLPAL